MTAALATAYIMFCMMSMFMAWEAYESKDPPFVGLWLTVAAIFAATVFEVLS